MPHKASIRAAQSLSSLMELLRMHTQQFDYHNFNYNLIKTGFLSKLW